ncbi:MAG: hypothetical protein K2H29_12435 [Oscillospiraceae bacterium]|nr:hypothetical protein [Oscillospiraceae bacterium]
MKKIISILTAGILFSAGVCGTFPVNSLQAYAVDFTELADQAAARVNVEREKQGLAPLKCSVALNNAAMIRCHELEIQNEHTRPDGTKYDTAIDEALNYAFYSSYAENIATGMTTAEQAVTTWMSSEIHSGNILNPDLEYLGIAVYEGEAGYYWTQLFIGGSEPLSDSYLPELKEEEPAVILGDLDGDQIVNSGDAAAILSAAAFIGSGAESELTTEQASAADVNADGNINAQDASLVLSYAAESGTGFTGTLEEYLAKNPEFLNF